MVSLLMPPRGQNVLPKSAVPAVLESPRLEVLQLPDGKLAIDAMIHLQHLEHGFIWHPVYGLMAGGWIGRGRLSPRLLGRARRGYVDTRVIMMP